MRRDDRDPRVTLHVRQVTNPRGATVHDAPAQHFENALRERRIVGDRLAESAQMFAQLGTAWRIRQLDTLVNERTLASIIDSAVSRSTTLRVRFRFRPDALPRPMI